MSVHQFPLADNRLAGVIAAPVDALALVEAAIERTGHLEALIRGAAPAPEIAAAAEAVGALRGPLASLRLTVDVFAVAIEAYRAEAFAAAASQRPYRRSRDRDAPLRAVPGTPQGRATRCAIAPRR